VDLFITAKLEKKVDLFIAANEKGGPFSRKVDVLSRPKKKGGPFYLGEEKSGPFHRKVDLFIIAKETSSAVHIEHCP